MIILCDENFPVKIAEGLSIIESANRDTVLQCTITHPSILNKTGTSDEEWIKYAGENDAIILTFDGDFKDVKTKGTLYSQNKIGAFFFRYDKKGGSRYWQTVRLLVNNLEEIKKIIVEKERPFVYRVTSSGKPERYEL
jgi:predicted nuclease of predicted toxin-antitoxin system